MTCLHCTKFNLRDFPSHARIGFGKCTIEQEKNRFFAMRHECKEFTRASPEVIEKRDAWKNELELNSWKNKK